MLKKLIKMGVVMSLLVTSVSAFAQNSGKIEYPRYSFGSNWSLGVALDFDWEAQQHGASHPDGMWRRSTNVGFDIFGMKKFHHAFDLRIRAHVPTLWRGLQDQPVDGQSFYMARYSTLTGELMWSISNAIHGYDPDRRWSAPYLFVGNVEARDLLADTADVLVCDGFSGNLVLKFMEGVAGTLMGIIKKELMADTRSKLGALMAKPAFRRVKKAMDYSEVGGAPLLGVQGAVVKAHGSSNAHAFASAIGQCVKMIDGRVVDIIAEGVRKMEAKGV